LGGSLDKDIFVPFRSMDQITSREEDVGVKVNDVLIEDDVSPGFIEASGGHGDNFVDF
jgi:hypothetical protein